MRKIISIPVLLTLIFVLSACTSGIIPAQDVTPSNEPSNSTQSSITANPILTPSSTPTATATPTPGEIAGTPTPDENKQVNLAINSLAKKLGLSPADIHLFSLEAVNWPDASLGCPQKGVLYIQIITPGYNIVLEAGEDSYNYHTDQGDRIVLCQPQTPQGIITTPEIYITPG